MGVARVDLTMAREASIGRIAAEVRALAEIMQVGQPVGSLEVAAEAPIVTMPGNGPAPDHADRIIKATPKRSSRCSTCWISIPESPRRPRWDWRLLMPPALGRPIDPQRRWARALNTKSRRVPPIDA